MMFMLRSARSSARMFASAAMAKEDDGYWPGLKPCLTRVECDNNNHKCTRNSSSNGSSSSSRNSSSTCTSSSSSTAAATATATTTTSSSSTNSNNNKSSNSIEIITGMQSELPTQAGTKNIELCDLEGAVDCESHILKPGCEKFREQKFLELHRLRV